MRLLVGPWNQEANPFGDKPMRTLILCSALSLFACNKSDAPAAAAPSGTLEAADLIAQVKSKKDAWIGKEVTVKGTLKANLMASDTQPKGGVSLENVQCAFANATPAADNLATGAPLTVRGKITSFMFGEVELSACQITQGL
jgi:hypothetical protein